MATYYKAFPFDEIKSATGDYYHDLESALADNPGYTEKQAWAVCDWSDSDGCILYGPPARFRVNLIGYILTNESHDMDLTYVEDVSP